MKPIRLEMEGFGSYLENTVLEFDKINKGLYLITGPTGSGKTTIFDAISYALYGVPSGSTRSEQALRSKNARLDTPTFVDLIFTYAGRKYHIRRNPRYIRAAKRGSGTGTEEPSVELDLPDGRKLTSMKTADPYIQNEIMHLTKDQFSKIAMLAQGEFQKLLISDTKDKMTIFRQIFRTSLYDTLSGKMANLRRDSADRRKVLDVAITEELKRVPDVGLDEATELKLQDVREKKMSVADSIEVIREVMEVLDGLYKEKSERIDTLSRAELELKNKLIGLKEYNTTLSRVEGLKARVPETEKAAAEADAVYKEAEKKNGEYKTALVLKLEDIKRKLKEIDGLESTRLSIARDERNLEQSRMKLSAMSTDLESLEKRVGEMVKIISSIPDRTEELTKLYDANEKLKIELDKVNTVLSSVDILEKAKHDEETAKSRFKSIHESYDEARRSYEEAYDIFYSQQAGILASTLEEGKPCPVCGSIHHPVPAELKDGSITDAELKRRQKVRDEWSLKVQSASSDAKVAEDRAQKTADDFALRLSELGIENGIEAKSELVKRYDEISADISSNDYMVQEIMNDNNRKNKAQVEKDKISSDLELRKKDRDALKSTIDSASGSLDEKKRALEEDQKKLGEYDVATLRNEGSNLQYEITDIEKSYRMANDGKRSADAALERLKSTLEAESNHLASLKFEDVDEEETRVKLDEATALKKEESNRQLDISTNMRILDSIIRNLGRNQKSYDEVDAEYRSINSLYETFTGQLSGAKKVGLETYVQMAYFDRILDRANTRLLSMTSNRYEMRREKLDDIESLQSQKGLDVLIVDHYEGCARAVQTLSGGEKFLASLCLALGLSEEIESEAGGVHLDSIFIDEGFGSLDSESITLAMKALGDIAGSEKMVGIISHVDALKERIDKKIIVSRNMQGESHAEIIC